MKNIYRLIIAVLIPMGLSAQDYAPFPYDSVFFESEIPNSDLMPVVKDPNDSSQILPVNIIPNLTRIVLGFNSNLEDLTALQNNWLGYKQKLGDTLIFETNYAQAGVFLEGWNAKIEIDLNAALLEKDTILFTDVLYHYGEDLYVEITHDSILIDQNDTVKQYSFQIMNSVYNPIDLELSYEMEPEEYYDINNQVFQISKHNGIIKSPDFNFFPYCKEYSFKGKVSDIISMDNPYAYSMFKREIGDEIHTKQFNGDLFKWVYLQTAIKLICTEQQYDSVSHIFYTHYDKWVRKDQGVFHSPTLSYIDTLVSATFNQIIDTTYLQEYDILNKKVPDGFSVDSTMSPGYFYQNSEQDVFKYFTVADWINGNNIIPIIIEYDGGQVLRYFHEGLGGEYFNASWSTVLNYYLPQYFSLADSIYGEPFTDSFILDIIENQINGVQFYIQDQKIVIDPEMNFQDFRIYDINGKLLDYYKAENISEGIDISPYPNGTYILIGYDGKSASHFKFNKN